MSRRNRKPLVPHYPSLGSESLEVRLMFDAAVSCVEPWDVQSSPEYNELGQLVSIITTGGFDEQGNPSWRSIERWDYDEQGRVLTTTFEQDHDADGVLDSRSVETNGYDHADNLVSVERSNDDNADGVLDSLSRVTIIVDEWVTVTTHELDNDGNGAMDSRSVETLTVDENGNPLTTRYQIDDDGDGEFDSDETFVHESPIDPTTSSTSEYDDDGNLIRLATFVDLDGDGIVDWQSLESYIYDDHGRVIEATYEYDENGDGTTDRWSQVTSEFNALTTTTTSQDDYEADGVIDFGSRVTETFDGDGNLLSSEFQVDSDGDGVYDTPEALPEIPISYSPSVGDDGDSSNDAANSNSASSGLEANILAQNLGSAGLDVPLDPRSAGAGSVLAGVDLRDDASTNSIEPFGAVIQSLPVVAAEDSPNEADDRTVSVEQISSFGAVLQVNSDTNADIDPEVASAVLQSPQTLTQSRTRVRGE